MFHSATVRLTAIYLGILLLICLIFNVALYNVLTGELNRDYVNQSVFFQHRPRFQPFLQDPEAEQFRSDQLTQGKQRIFLELVYVDIALLVTGGFASYFFARKTLEPIEEAHNAQVRFTADASHELRTPLATMQTEVEVALRDPKLSLGESKALLESNLEELATLRHLTTGLLTLARGNDTDTPRTAVSLKATVDDATVRVEKLASSKHMVIRANIPKSLAVTGDGFQLTEAVVVLLDNAIKYGSEKQKITVTGTAEPNQVLLSISDSGIGIAKDDLTRIFDRFYRTDSARSKSKQAGHGLGLAIAKQIVEQHGGTLTAQSEVGKGTTMTITLPTSTTDS